MERTREGEAATERNICLCLLCLIVLWCVVLSYPGLVRCLRIRSVGEYPICHYMSINQSKNDRLLEVLLKGADSSLQRFLLWWARQVEGQKDQTNGYFPLVAYRLLVYRLSATGYRLSAITSKRPARAGIDHQLGVY